MALGTALAASLGLSGYLVFFAHKYYVDASAVRLDPGGLKTWETDRSRARPEEPILVFFGDSRAFMWSEPAAPTGFHVLNRGVSYQTTAQMLLRFDADVASLHPAVVVLEAGVNDLKAVAEFPSRRDEIVRDCEANLTTLVHRMTDLGAQVVLVSVFRIGDVPLWRRPFWSADVDAAVPEVNAFLRGLAQERARDGVVWFDANPLLEGEGGRIRRSYEIDHLHLNADGYAAINAGLVPLLRSLAERGK